MRLDPCMDGAGRAEKRRGGRLARRDDDVLATVMRAFDQIRASGLGRPGTAQTHEPPNVDRPKLVCVREMELSIRTSDRAPGRPIKSSLEAGGRAWLLGLLKCIRLFAHSVGLRERAHSSTPPLQPGRVERRPAFLFDAAAAPSAPADLPASPHATRPLPIRPPFPIRGTSATGLGPVRCWSVWGRRFRALRPWIRPSPTRRV